MQIKNSNSKLCACVVFNKKRTFSPILLNKFKELALFYGNRNNFRKRNKSLLVTSTKNDTLLALYGTICYNYNVPKAT